MSGSVVSLQVCPGYRKPMRPIEEVEVIPNLGIKGDTHALPDSVRQVLLIEKETLEALSLQTGDVKENITTAGIALMSLKPKQRLRIGSSVLLEITKPCSPCSRMNEIRPGLIKEIAGRRGMLARVLEGGKMRIGDSIQIVSE